MFGIDFPEFMVIAVVALVVLGPERLPKAARFAGLWVRRARAQWASVKNELERELAAEELKRSLHDTETAMRDIDASVRAADTRARREFDAMREAARAPAGDPRDDTLHGDTPRDDAAPHALTNAAEDAAPPVAMTPLDHRGEPPSASTPAERDDDVRHRA